MHSIYHGTRENGESAPMYTFPKKPIDIIAHYEDQLILSDVGKIDI